MMAKRPREDSTTLDDSSLPNVTPQKIISEQASHMSKYVELDATQLTSRSSTRRTSSTTHFRCLLPPHQPMTFTSYPDYEAHYKCSHTNRCQECQKNFPTSHFLDLHLSENHDPIVAAKLDKGEKVFACFVESCDKLCADWKRRRRHLVDKHGFPRNYDFLVVNSGVDGKWSMLRPGVDVQGHRKTSRERPRSGSSATELTQTTEATELSTRSDEPAEDKDEVVDDAEVVDSVNTSRRESAADANLDDITKSMSSLHFVPRSVKFGRRKGKTGFAKS